MTEVWYFVREFSESCEFPEVHIFMSEAEARAAMITEALEACDNLSPAWVTEEMDGPEITNVLLFGGITARTVTTLNVERPDGAVDCFRLFSQTIEEKTDEAADT